MRHISVRRKTNDRAFTLIELIVVVVIVGIIAAVAIPSYIQHRERAFVATLVSDCRNVATEMQSYYSANLAFPTEGGTQMVGGVPISNIGGARVNISPDVTVWSFVNNEVNYGHGAFVLACEHERSRALVVLASTEGASPKSVDLDEYHDILTRVVDVPRPIRQGDLTFALWNLR